MNQPRDGATATLLSDGRVLVAGGNDGLETLRSAEIFNPVTETWLKASPMAAARAYHSAVLLPNGRVFVSGGEQMDGTGHAYAIRDAEVYDPDSDMWSPAAEMPAPASRHASFVIDDELVVVPQAVPEGSTGASEELARLDFRTNRWSLAGSPFLWHVCGASVLDDSADVILFAGGWVGPTGLWDFWSRSTESWNRGATIGIARSCPIAVRLPGDGVLVSGGESDGSAVPSEIFHIHSGKFEQVGSPHYARRSATSVSLADGNVLQIGGMGDHAASTFELFQVATHEWTVPGTLNIPRYSGHVSVVLNDGRVLVAGGRLGFDESTAAAEIRDMPRE